MSVLWWVAVADGLAALYLAAHTVLHRPRNAPQVAVVAIALLVVGLALGWLALRSRPPPPPAPVEQPDETRGPLPAGPVVAPNRACISGRL